ncbi:RidA family protein [Aestuariivita sp.]|jgi:enamine deaminase RidA (YjgF/YER057c/UK114 family)|uniref:RidA family protein n=1 Tax=Aestuariivita sp. TaxID=1872407 RepID=UPI0021724B49|nr:RidA family protein [Aestuariivita sp.]MCE8006121.1 RidA family protein [Aestuariivita sp.]
MTETPTRFAADEADPVVDLTKVIPSLPTPEGTRYPYDLVTIEGGTAYLAGQIPKQNGRLAYVGKVGSDVGVEQAAVAARICAQQALAWLNRSAGGLENLNRLLRLTCYVAHDDTFSDISSVADGASQYLIATLGDAGRHTRAVIGVKSLPRNAPVLIEVTASLRGPV